MAIDPIHYLACIDVARGMGAEAGGRADGRFPDTFSPCARDGVLWLPIINFNSTVTVAYLELLARDFGALGALGDPRDQSK